MAIDRTKIAQQAEKLVVQGRVDAAIAQYELLVRDNPRDMNTINKIGDLYSRLGKRKEAIAQFSKIGDFYAKDGFLLKAIAIYKKITKLDPSHMDTYQRLADLYAQQGLVLEARAQYQFVSDRYLKAGDTKRAIVAIEALVRVDPENFQHRVALADLIAKNGRAAEAAEEYARAAAEMERRGLAQEARVMYQKASSLQPGSPATAVRLASSHAAGGDVDGAVGILTEALKKHGDNVDLLATLSDLHVKAGRHQDAEAAIRKAVSQAPTRSDMRLKMGRLKITAGDPDAAFEAIEPHVGPLVKERSGELLPLLESILAANARHKGALLAATEAYAAVKNEEKVVGCLSKLLDLSIEAGEQPEGQRFAERLVKLRPADATFAAKLSQLQGSAAKAVRSSTPPDKKASAAAPERAPSPAAPSAAAAPAEGPLNARPTPDAGPAVPTASASLEPEDEDFITEHMTEADVFVKYGLGDRAVEQLMAVLERYPAYAPAHDKLKEIYLEEGNREAARAHMAQAVRARRAQGDRPAAEEALAELRRFDPASREGAELEAIMSGGDVAAWAARPVPQEGDFLELSEPAPAAAGRESVRGGADSAGGGAAAGPAPADLADVDASLARGQHEAAVAVLRRLAESHGSHPEILARMRQAMALKESISGLRQGMATAAQSAAAAHPQEDEIEISLDDDDEPAHQEPVAAHPPAPTPQAAPVAPAPGREGGLEDLLDLAAEIDAALGAAEGSEESLVTGQESTPEGHSLEEIVEAFKKGIEQQVDAEDYDTHYNLGIAYKEMGLVDEAIGEFQFAARDDKLLVDCCSMLGVCFREKGMGPLAVKWYRRGLEAANAGRTEETMLGLRYDLADLLLEIGNQREALTLFTEVFGTNSKYRDVAVRLKELERTLSQ